MGIIAFHILSFMPSFGSRLVASEETIGFASSLITFPVVLALLSAKSIGPNSLNVNAETGTNIKINIL